MCLTDVNLVSFFTISLHLEAPHWNLEEREIILTGLRGFPKIIQAHAGVKP